MEAQVTALIRSFLQEPSFRECTERLHFQSGEVILFEHQSDRDLYLIESGKICIKKNDQSDIYLGSGTLIGELSFLQGVRRTATIIAEDETLCLQIREVLFRSWLKAHPQESISFYRHLSSAIAERLRSNIQREETLQLFGQESPILQQTEKEILSLANRLRDCHKKAEVKKKGIEEQMRDE